MIQFTKSYKTEDGQVFATIEEAKRHELILALQQITVPSGANLPYDDIATLLLTAQDEVVDILTTTPHSKPKARAVHGGTKKRNKTIITNARASIIDTINTFH